MKKFTLLFISILAVQVLFSQTVLTNSYNFTIGDTYRYDGYSDVTSIDPGSGGANMVWDFGTISGGSYNEGLVLFVLIQPQQLSLIQPQLMVLTFASGMKKIRMLDLINIMNVITHHRI